MKEITLEEYVKFDHIKDINNAIIENAENQKLTVEIVEKLLQDKELMFWMYGFEYSDVSSLDLSELSFDVFKKIPFSTYTKFPEISKLPKYFNPQKVVSQAMEDCYRFDVEDKNCTIAIIDNPTQFYLHEQFKDLKHEIIDYSQKNAEAHFHVDGVLSNIASVKFGYGHNAKYLVYVVDWNSHQSRLESHLKALQNVYDRIVNGEKIQVVSISNLLIEKELEKTETAKQVMEMVEVLKNNPYYKCQVVDSMLFHKSGFQPIYCDMLDKPTEENYKYSYNKIEMPLGVPINKIEPLFGTVDGYKIKTNSSSSSWAIPILSYFYAVCRQYGDLSFDDYVALCSNTINENKNGVKIVNFELVVEKTKSNTTTLCSNGGK